MWYNHIQGDVVGVYDSTGTKVVGFRYDAFGRCTVIGDVNLAQWCKIRYRGYYYDTETGLYWVQTRYYNPDWCRWISLDSISYLDPEIPHGLNLYLYCGNDPVNYVDSTGNSQDSIWKTLFGIVVGVGLAIVTVAAVVASGGALLVPALVGAVAGAGLNLIGQGVSNIFEGKGFFEDISWWNVGLGAISGAAFATGIGGLGGAFAIGSVSNAGMSAFEQKSWANIGFNAIVGGLSAMAGYSAGKFISSKLLNINTNLGLGDYIKMARVDGAGFWTRNSVALISMVYTMGSTFAMGATRGVTKTIGNWIGGLF